METSLAEDVKKPTRTLSPDSFFFMSPYRSFTTSGCFRRFSQPAVGGDALNGEFQQQMAAAFAEARAAGIRKPVMVGAIPFDTCQPSELYIPERWEAFSRPEKQRSARYAAPLEAMDRRRLHDVSLKAEGKPATTRKRYFSAMVPACWLYSVMFANSLRRYIWMTFSM